jgi:hypothetical protein
MTDLRHHVLAENITKEYIELKPYGWIIKFDFLCPNCGRYHKSTERTIAGIVRRVEYELACGHVKVRMPWADYVPPLEAKTTDSKTAVTQGQRRTS